MHIFCEFDVQKESTVPCTSVFPELPEVCLAPSGTGRGLFCRPKERSLAWPVKYIAETPRVGPWAGSRVPVRPLTTLSATSHIVRVGEGLTFTAGASVEQFGA
jgi:hypothetical protein